MSKTPRTGRVLVSVLTDDAGMMTPAAFVAPVADAGKSKPRKPLPDAQREARNAKARERYAAKRAAEGKTYTPRSAKRPCGDGKATVQHLAAPRPEPKVKATPKAAAKSEIVVPARKPTMVPDVWSHRGNTKPGHAPAKSRYTGDALRSWMPANRAADLGLRGTH